MNCPHPQNAIPSDNHKDKEEAGQQKRAYDKRLKMLMQEACKTHINRAENKSKTAWEVIHNAKKKKLEPKALQLYINNRLINDPKKEQIILTPSLWK